jgi:hypothetical protein
MADVLPVAAIRWGSIPPLLLISLAVMGSPGPATISLVAVGSVFGVRHSLKYLIGISVAYILWLAYHIATAPLLSEQTAAADAPSFAGGALLGVAERGGRPPCRPSPAGSRSSLRDRIP